MMRLKLDRKEIEDVMILTPVRVDGRRSFLAKRYKISNWHWLNRLREKKVRRQLVNILQPNWNEYEMEEE